MRGTGWPRREKQTVSNGGNPRSTSCYSPVLSSCPQPMVAHKGSRIRSPRHTQLRAALSVLLEARETQGEEVLQEATKELECQPNAGEI